MKTQSKSMMNLVMSGKLASVYWNFGCYNSGIIMKLNREDSWSLWFQGYFHPNSGALQYGHYHWPLLTCEAHAESSTSLQGMLLVCGKKELLLL
uniref:Uncharacterized protein n=1 Tax=Triticum urartu TaxID=4572 RepID=A0A8R7TM66_TRIUA